VRGAAVAGLLVLAPVTAGIGMFALSHPGLQYLMPGGKYTVLGMKLVQDQGIYLYLDFGQGHPRSLVLPWNQDMADQLQELGRKQQGGRIPGIEGEFPPFEWSWDRNPPQFHPLPQPIIPIPKERNEEPERYEREA
jgi:hypothetical protein